VDPITIAALIGAGTQLLKGNGSSGGGSGTPGLSNSDVIFGPSMFAPDSSGWLVNFGDAATQSQSNAARTGPTQSYTPTQTPTQTQSGAGGYSGMLPGSSGTYSQGNPAGSSGQPSGALTGSIPMVYLLGGGALLLVLVLVAKRGK
jgi:hypothetical protein